MTIVTEKENETERKSNKDRNIDSIVFVFKPPTPLDIDRHPAIEFARAHKIERNFKAPSSRKRLPTPVHIFSFYLAGDTTSTPGKSS